MTRSLRGHKGHSIGQRSRREGGACLRLDHAHAEVGVPLEDAAFLVA